MAARSAKVAAHVLAWPEFQGARRVLAYLATPSEVQTADLLRAAFRVCVPVVVGADLVLRELGPETPLHRGALGIREPGAAAAVVPPEEVDLALVPGVAFDWAGHRIGRGGGYYDRLLPRLSRATTCGLAFREQVVTALDPAPWDVAVGYICTEDGLAAAQQPS